jgi:DNA-binding response OmpR family regulator
MDPRTAAVNRDGAAGGRSATILVVEDEAPIRQIMVRALSARGHDVIAVSSGDEALAEVARHPEVALLITDMVMRGMNGLQLALRLRETHPALPVLYVSGFSPQQTGLAQAEPDAPFLQKPFALDELIARVDALLAR